jgi:hypothetical protein
VQVIDTIDAMPTAHGLGADVEIEVAALFASVAN